MCQADRAILEKYIQDRAETVLKQPRSFIRYPFIDPGSVYDGNVWDWDTFWSVYGLFSVAELFPAELNERILTHAEGNVRNFFDHQQPDGYIPMMIEVAEWPEPYLVMKHKEGVRMNMHKPFLASQMALISRHKGDWEWTRTFVEPLERYFDCYQNYFNENCGLYVWHDDIMIGMDNDPASFGRPQDSTANIYLNSFMVMELAARPARTESARLRSSSQAQTRAAMKLSPQPVVLTIFAGRLSIQQRSSWLAA